MSFFNTFFGRSGDEIDQVAHGRWGRNEGSDVSDAPITDDSESGSESDSRSDESRTPSRSPTPRRDLEERSQSRGSFAEGIEAGTVKGLRLSKCGSVSVLNERFSFIFYLLLLLLFLFLSFLPPLSISIYLYLTLFLFPSQERELREIEKR